MPDLDTGHIFLTTMAPIKSGTLADGHGSYRQRLRKTLVELPVAQQSPATVPDPDDPKYKDPPKAPLSRNTRTHLARMFVLDDVVYNGREGHDAIASSIKGALGNAEAANPALPQHIDRLNCAYLVFCADIDAVVNDGDSLPKVMRPETQERVRRSYAEELWRTMGPELVEIYSNCEGFDGIDNASAFADYLEKCHVETTMPFHDYYIGDVSGAFHHLNVGLLAAVVGIPAIFTIIAFFSALFGVAEMPFVGGSAFWSFVIGLGVTAAAFVGAVKYAIANGEKPLPPGPYDDLPSVLKALYVQQAFSGFAIDQQGAPPEDLHAAFDDWLKEHQPHVRSEPTQEPGVIRATGV